MATFSPEETALIEKILKRLEAGGFSGTHGSENADGCGGKAVSPKRRRQLAITLEVAESLARTGGVKNIYFQKLEADDGAAASYVQRRIVVAVPAGAKDGDLLYLSADEAEAEFPDLCIYIRVMPDLPKPQAKNAQATNRVAGQKPPAGATARAQSSGSPASAGRAQSFIEPLGRSRGIICSISSAEAETGGRRREMIVRNCICRTCGGTGRVGGKPCGKCRNGVVQKRERIQFDLPPGISSGMRFRLAGKGDEGTERNGDLILTFNVK